MQTYDIELIILNILTDLTTAICLVGALFLIIRGKNNKARRMLGYMLLAWGLCSVGRSVCLQMGCLPLLLHPMRTVGLLGGNFFIILILFFPIEVMFPGWLNFKRLLLLFLPITLLTIIYQVGLSITGQSVQELNTFSDFIDNISHFNVWYRLLFLMLVIAYNVALLKLIHNNEKKYLRWKNENYADVEYLDMSWMRFYAIGSLVIFIFWIPNVLYASIINFLMHTIVVDICFSYFIYKGLFYESAYPADYFKDVNGIHLLSEFSPCEVISKEEGELIPDEEIENISFEDKIPAYVDTFNTWMEKEKPYLYKDFKLTDVSRVLPLNRSYLSRVLNEGLGMNFCQVVRKYRIEASKKLLLDNPDMPIYLVAEQCGFSSDTTFIRAFQQEMKVTPSRYRVEN